MCGLCTRIDTTDCNKRSRITNQHVEFTTILSLRQREGSKNKPHLLACWCHSLCHLTHQTKATREKRIANMATAAEQMYMKWSRKKMRISKKKRNVSATNSSSVTFNTFTPKTTPRFRERQNNASSRKKLCNISEKSEIDNGKVERMIRSAEVQAFDDMNLVVLYFLL